MIQGIKKDLRRVAGKDKAKVLAGFFKTGKGEYGEGDKFLGVIVPEQRRIAKKYLATPLPVLQKLLASEYHEERLTALLILVEQYKRADDKNKKIIFNFYLKNISRVNNWDLVDLSAPNIIGDYLFTLSKVEGLNYSKKILLKLAKSKNLWSRRVVVLATFTFIKNNQFREILDLTEFLIFKQKEKHDLLYKALGWMLREMGKHDLKVLENFLNNQASQLPRVTLRYAIERLPEPKRKRYLASPAL